MNVTKSVIHIPADMFVEAACAALLTGGAAEAQELKAGEIITGYFGDVAIKGFDPVAYFTAGKPLLGDPQISTEWLGAEWHFINEKDRDLFIADPIAYAPQCGGHCADGLAYVATAVTVNIDPTAWRIIDGKLYLNYDPESAADLANTPGLAGKAYANWVHLIRPQESARSAQQVYSYHHSLPGGRR